MRDPIEFDPAALLDPTTAAFVQDPYQAYSKVRTACPVAGLPDGSWVVTGTEEVMRVLRDADTFTSTRNLDGDHAFTPEARAVLDQSQYFGRGMFNADPPDHGRMRALLADFFSPRGVRRLGPAVAEATNELVDEFRGDGRCDLISRLAYPMPLRVICGIMGVPDEDRDMVKGWSQDWTALLVLPLDPDEQLRRAKSVVQYDQYLAALLEERRSRPAEDAASVLAEAALGPERACTPGEAIVVLRSLLLAGHETASGLIGNTLHHLLRTGGWTQVVEDRSSIPVAVEEVLRLDPSSQSTSRTARRAISLGGAEIPAGARIHPMTGAVGRDPDRCPDADAFRLDRTSPVRHVAFGLGAHFCLGAPLAKLEVQTVLEVLATELPGLRLAPGFAAAFTPGGFSFRGLQSLDVVWQAGVAE